MVWPALLVPVWLGGMETYVLSTPTTAVLTCASMAHVRYVFARVNFNINNVLIESAYNLISDM